MTVAALDDAYDLQIAGGNAPTTVPKAAAAHAVAAQLGGPTSAPRVELPARYSVSRFAQNSSGPRRRSRPTQKPREIKSVTPTRVGGVIDTDAGRDPRITVVKVSLMRSRTTTKNSLSSPTRTRIDLLLFVLVTVLISGPLWLILASLGGDVNEGDSIAIFTVATSGPSLAALGLYLTRTRRAKSSAPHQRISAPWKWGPAALVLGAVPAVAAYLLFAPQDLGPRITAAPGVVAGFGGTAMFILLFMIAGPLAEEFGWRGYAQPRLRRSFGVLTTSAIIGVAWWAWHIPLFFLPGTGQATMGFLTFESLRFALSFIPLSLIYLYVSERLGGGVWAAVLLHFSTNAAGTLLPDESSATGVARFAVIWLLAAIVYFTWRPEAREPLGTGSVRGGRVLSG